ncbi:uncharacterized protein [Littorina saxatilis]
MKDSCHVNGLDYCHNGGTCTNTQTGALCHCTPQYDGEQCDVLKPTTTGAPQLTFTGSLQHTTGTIRYSSQPSTVKTATPQHPALTSTSAGQMVVSTSKGVGAVSRTTSLPHRGGTSLSGTGVTSFPLAGVTSSRNTGVTSLLHLLTTFVSNNTTIQISTDDDSGCSVILCYIVIPTISVLASVIIAIVVSLIVYYKAVKRRREMAKVSPRMPAAV